jgi:hypothetical protein
MAVGLLVLSACGRSVEHVETNAPLAAPRDPALLAAVHCEAFGLPAFEPTPIGDGDESLEFGPCGHLYVPHDIGTVFSPDLAQVVAETLADASFSPDGTHVIFEPPPPEPSVVRRLDLVSGTIHDTPIGTDAPRAVLYGLFPDAQGLVESWICENGTLRIYADREDDQPPLFELAVPSCLFDSGPQTGALVWSEGNTLKAVDLPERRAYTHTVPSFESLVAGSVDTALDGYVMTPVVYVEELAGDVVEQYPREGPLYDTRTGEHLADKWERVAMAEGRSAANRLEPDFALFTDDGHAVVTHAGLRGLYVFRDQTRAFALRASDGGSELVLVNFVTSETQVLGAYPGVAPLDGIAFDARFGVSPGEKAAYFFTQILGAWDEGLPQGVYRWVDGAIDEVREVLPASAAIAQISDDGTALVNASDGAYRLRPGADVASLPPEVAAVLSADGSAACLVTYSADASRGGYGLTVTNVDSGSQRFAIPYFNWSNHFDTDGKHERFAISVMPEPGALTAQIWAGRFPTAPLDR